MLHLEHHRVMMKICESLVSPVFNKERFHAHLHWQLLFFSRPLAQSAKPYYLGSYL